MYHYISRKRKDQKQKTAHDREHTVWNRRSFIQALGLAGAGGIMLGQAAVSASRPSPLAVALSQSENDNILVIIRLKGGNDGLNTIVPVYAYDDYANLRPTIKHAQNDLYNLNADFAIPTYMESLQSVWGEGKMKVIHGVGYQNQNLSHFRSSDIWASGEPEFVEPTGWWGRYFEDIYPDYLVNPPAVPPAIQIGSTDNIVLEGNDTSYAFSFANASQLENVAQNGNLHDVVNIPDCLYGNKLQFLRAMTNTTYIYSQVIHDAYMASSNSVNYENLPLSEQLAMIARMVKGGLGTKVYMVTLDGFDNHANQVNDHRALLEDLSKSIKNFYEDLATAGMDDKVLAMTISEFGRRPYENGSNGTDHGAASPVMLFGAGLNGSGFVGTHPDINEWDADDNLIPTTDFRDVYSSVLTDWFCLDPSVVSSILLNYGYTTLDLGFSCDTLETPSFEDVTRFEHFPVYKNNRVYIHFKLPTTAHVDVRLYDITGREIGALTNEMLFPGAHNIDVLAKVRATLSTGQYIYRIAIGGQFYSKSLLIK